MMTRLARRVRSLFGEAPTPKPKSPSRGRTDLSAEAPARRIVTRAEGRAIAVSVRPLSNGAETLTVDLETADGVIELVWMGRRSIPGIRPGAHLRVRGRLTGERGPTTIHNPAYELLVGSQPMKPEGQR